MFLIWINRHQKYVAEVLGPKRFIDTAWRAQAQRFASVAAANAAIAELGMVNTTDASVHLSAYACWATDDVLQQRLRDAPPEDEPISETEEQAVAEAREALRRGEVVSHAEMRRELGIEDADAPS